MTFRGNISPPCKWELKLTETSKGERKSWWLNSSAVEKNKLKVIGNALLYFGMWCSYTYGLHY